MRRDVLELRQFYASDLGAAARLMVGRKVVEAWGDAHGLDVLALGYATPFVASLMGAARRLVDEDALPFRNALFDRILMVHALEEAPDAVALLREVWRVMAPAGRVIVVV